MSNYRNDDMINEVFKALGDPTRLKIVRMLAERGEVCVCEFAEEMALSQPAISHHMATLRHAGIVNCRRTGQWVHYSLDTDFLRSGPLQFLRELAELADKAKESEEAGGCCPPARSSATLARAKRRSV